MKGRPRQSFVIAAKIGPLRDNRRGLISELIDQGISPAQLKKDCQSRGGTDLNRKWGHIHMFKKHIEAGDILLYVVKRIRCKCEPAGNF